MTETAAHPQNRASSDGIHPYHVLSVSLHILGAIKLAHGEKVEPEKAGDMKSRFWLFPLLVLEGIDFTTGNMCILSRGLNQMEGNWDSTGEGHMLPLPFW